jgi:uncharacterized protein (TIGR03435 family)
MAVMSSPSLLEPGVVGIRRPVLLLPEGIVDRLKPSQLNAIVVHELCHVRRRDNLVALVHMVVEALYWFHPLVWWIETRLVDERERACDEEVLRMGSEPDVYAEGLLNVCKFYAESTVVCASGVTGSDLQRRIEAIMRNRAGDALNVRKKLLLVVTAVLALAAPIVVGVLNAPLRAQSRPSAANRLAFEAASVKQNKSGGPSNRDFAAGGRFTARNTSLRMLIQLAYRIQDFQLSGEQHVLGDRFDIVAKAEGNPPVNDLQLMLRTLLADRFRLTVRNETRELPMYALVMARRDRKLGAQLRRSGVGCAPITVPPGVNAAPPPPPPPGALAPAGPGPDADPNRVGHGCGGMLLQGRVSGRTMTMTQVANTLSRFLNRVVTDRTGLTGNFDLDLVYTPEQMPNGPGGLMPAALAPPSDGPSIFTAVQEQLGLKLASTKGPVQVLVIDHVEGPSDDQAATSPAATPAFEVASVKPNNSRAGERAGNLAGGRLTLTSATLRELVQLAYQRQDGHLRYDSQISGGPSWINSDHFDVVANAAGMPAGLDAAGTAAGAATSAELSGLDQVRLMLRTLLADRFRLTVHNEFRDRFQLQAELFLHSGKDGRAVSVN